ncbi:hypothetical protein [Brachybacterium sp. GCM10030252]|uniref:hypothetical protein n=1 Tax=Brachybacterium sp. GCM10030252 TaxID=3273380 RepID=UPI00361CEC3C
MAYQSPYGAPYQSSYGYVPPPKKRGMKRIVFGILGIVANLIGLVVMPIIAGFVAAVIAGMGLLESEPLDPNGGTISTSSMNAYMIAVPVDEVDQVTCDFTGSDGEEVNVEPQADTDLTTTVDGVEYQSIYQINTFGGQDVTVDCQGASSAAYSEMGLTGIFVSIGIGLLLPVVLGIAALILLIWGIVARVRS